MSNALKWQCLRDWLEQTKKQSKYGRQKPKPSNNNHNPKPKYKSK